jgi:hypothetical protein
MTVLILDRLWINRIDTGEAITEFTTQGSRSQQYANKVEVRTYAGGRRRAIGVAGEEGTVAFQLALPTLATTELLRTWKGLAVRVRDHRGQKWIGVIAQVDVGEYMEATLYTATVQLLVTSHTEGM